METKIQDLIMHHYQVNSLKNAYQKEDYFQLMLEGEEVGYIDKFGIHLRCYHSKCPQGVLIDIEIWKDRTPREMAKLVQKHWPAIYDRFTLKSKFNK